MSRRRFVADERGNMAILFSLGFTLATFVAALAIDGGSLYHERRALQAGVDLAAISAAADPSRAAEIARSVLSDARLLAPGSTEGLEVTTGNYDATRPDIADRFRANAVPRNAVRVTFERPGTLYFAAGVMAPPMMSASGTATAMPEAAFSLGTRVASLDGGIANALLSQALGTTVSLSLLDYNALASARIDALTFLETLSQRLYLHAGTYDEVLAARPTAGAIAGALASLTNGAARTALSRLFGSTRPVALDRVFDLGRAGNLQLGQPGAAAGLSMNALDLINAIALLSDGTRQVSLNLGANVPGLVSLGLDAAIGEPPQGGWFAYGRVGTTLRSAQLRLRIAAQLLSGPILLGAGIKLPLWLDLAPAQATLVSISCPSAAMPNGAATIAVRPGLLQLGLGTVPDASLRDFTKPLPRDPVTLIDALLLKVYGSAALNVGATTATTLSFSSTDIGAGTIRIARTTTPLTSLFGSLLANLNLTVSILGLGLSPEGVIKAAVQGLLVPLAAPLDATVSALLATLGLGIGEADIRVHGVRCSQPVLVG